MTNAQLYVAVGLPTIAVIASLVINLFQLSGMRGDMREIRGDLRLITGKVAEMDTRLSVIEERLK